MHNLTSKALLANLSYTFVEKIRYDVKYKVLLKIYSIFSVLKTQIANDPIYLGSKRYNLSIIPKEKSIKVLYGVIFNG